MGKKAVKEEVLGIKTAHDHRNQGSIGTGKDIIRDIVRLAIGDQGVPGIGNAGHTRITEIEAVLVEN